MTADHGKLCSKCKTDLPITEFYADTRARDGLQSQCRTCGHKSGAGWRIRNKDRINEKGMEWRKNNPEKVRESRKKCEASPEYKLKRAAYTAANSNRRRDWYQNYAKENPEKIRARRSARRAREKAASGRITADEIRSLLKKQRGKCTVCLVKLGENYHLDHVMPLARGGDNTVENAQLLCPTCNRRKNAKDPIVFRQQLGYLI